MSRPISRSSPAAFRVFDAVFNRWMAHRIRAVRILGTPAVREDGPVLLCANHVSWWDGFLLRRLAMELRPSAPLFTVMLNREIESRPWLRRLGAIGVTPGSMTSVRQMLRDLRAVARQHPTAVVSFFPQGRIWPAHRRPLGFERGIEAVLRAVRPTSVVPVGLKIEPGRHLKPTAYLLPELHSEPGPDGTSYVSLERAVEGRLNLIDGFLAKYGEDVDNHSFEEPLCPPHN